MPLMTVRFTTKLAGLKKDLLNESQERILAVLKLCNIVLIMMDQFSRSGLAVHLQALPSMAPMKRYADHVAGRQ